MSEPSVTNDDRTVSPPEEPGFWTTLVSIAAKAMGILVALALLSTVTIFDPQTVTEKVLVPIFGEGWIEPEPPIPPLSPEFKSVYTSVSERRIAETVKYLSECGSRVPGYPGAEKAFDYIKARVVRDLTDSPCLVQVQTPAGEWAHEPRALAVVKEGEVDWSASTARPVGAAVTFDRPVLTEETFDVTVPVDEGAAVTILGDGSAPARRVPVHCLWPNNVQTSSLPREGITGTLIDGGRGHPDDFHDSVDGAIALVEFGCDKRYINLRMLGAKAVVFYVPEGDGGDTAEQVNFTQAQDKMLVVPADIPRYYVEPAGARVLKGLLQMDRPPERRTVSRAARRVRLQARMRWKTVQAKNLILELPGSPQTKKSEGGRVENAWREQRIVLSAYYDSISVVPALAPGAENAAGVASLLEMIRALAQWRERQYTLTFVITSAHFQGMAGISDWLSRHARKNKTFLSEIEDRQTDVLTLHSGEVLRGQIVSRGSEELAIDLADGGRKTVPAADVRTTSRTSDLVPFKLFIGLDLSSRYPQVAAFSEGAFTNPLLSTNNYRKNALAPYAKTFEKYHKEVFQELEDKLEQPEDWYTHGRYFNAITPAKRSWKNFMPSPLGFEHEMVHRVGGAALTLATPNDYRAVVDTPLDTYQTIAPYIGNVATQAQTVTALLMKASRDYEFFPETKLELPDDAGAIEGQIVWFDRDVSFFVPKAPVSGALVTYQMTGWQEASCGGVRTMIATQTTRGEPQRDLARRRGMIGDAQITHDTFSNEEDAGRFTFKIRHCVGATLIEAYAFDDAGRVVFAPDRGQEGDKNYPMSVPAASGVSNTTEVLFPCRAITVLEIVDSRRLAALDSLTVLTSSDAEPQWYGTKAVADQSTKEGRTVPAAVVFVRPDQRVKLFMSTGLFGIKYLLINADERLLDDPAAIPEVIRGTRLVEGGESINIERASRGRGYLPTESVIFHPFYKAARDMWIVDDIRLKRMAHYGIRNERVARLHEEARDALLLAREAFAEEPPDYATYISESRRAWGLEARGYPDVKKTASDSVNGIVFYFMLLLPFSFFCERLLFGFKDIRAKLAGVAGVFAAVFLLLHLVHPAFRLTTSPYIILLAFIVLVLGLVVLIILMRKFGEEVQKSKRASSGLHEVDVGRLSATAAAINLGINNLRKRKVRTSLTAVTLVLLTFTVLSFTSIQTSLKPFVLPHGTEPLYEGALIRERAWQGLQQSKLDYVRSTFGRRYATAGGAVEEDADHRRWSATVVPRAWIQAKVKGDKEFIPVRNEAKGTSASAFGLMGFVPDERAVIAKAAEGEGFRELGLVDGDGRPVWIEPGERHVCFMSKHMADLLDIAPDEVGTARVWMYGQSFRVKGIFEGSVFNDTIKDLDGEPLTPVDFVKESSEIGQATTADPSRQAAQPIRQFEHIDAKNCLIIPYETARDLGGILASIALVDFTLPEGHTPREGETWLDGIKHFMDRVALTVFVGTKEDRGEGSVNVWSSLSRTDLGRVGNLLVPIVIAAFIVLNTMIGAVYERAREIGIYSSIGLTPKHVAALFLAESAVFATVGAVVGYLIGQSLVRGLTALGWLEGSGMVLNYSSLSAIWSTVVVMLTTFLSTLYPAKKAAAMAVPDVTRRWKFPEPAGDDWYFDFPFTLGGHEVPGIYTYLARVFESYGEGSVGGFLTEDVQLSARPSSMEAVLAHPEAPEGAADLDAAELGPTYIIVMKTWLAPYDLGISQSVRLEAIPTGEANIYRIAMSLHRESGDVASWRRINRGFLNVLRKRFLVWRTMAPGLREEYLEQGQELTRMVTAQ